MFDCYHDDKWTKIISNFYWYIRIFYNTHRCRKLVWINIQVHKNLLSPKADSISKQLNIRALYLVIFLLKYFMLISKTTFQKYEHHFIHFLTANVVTPIHHRSTHTSIKYLNLYIYLCTHCQCTLGKMHLKTAFIKTSFKPLSIIVNICKPRWIIIILHPIIHFIWILWLISLLFI
jgi:hypothetical protein